ncbi:MAG: LD-carboxypeptidase [Nitrospinaceae bacterium]|nr:LD-carboxypeptidase [Nitrospinaceae bacterium]MBT6347076.1 LD-carboxypeptidase [Nitrospina sp.]
MSNSILPLLRPSSLRQGDVVGVVAPAGPVDKHQLEVGLEVIRRMGFEPVLSRNIHARSRFMAGSDKMRAQDIMDMFRDPEVRAIFCARGGYGSNRVLAHLDPDVIRRNAKVVVGSSDITLLLHYLVQKCGLVAFHGPMVAGSFGRAEMKKSQRQFKALLTGDVKARHFCSPRAKVFSKGVAQGKLTGGCLTLLCRSLNTPYEIQTRNRILLIEDVNEPLYRVDGMLWQLKNAGMFKGIRGIVLGEMVNCRSQRKGDGTIENILQDLFPKPKFPILTHCPIGHGKEVWTLPLETSAILDSESKTLELKHCGVKMRA